MTKKRNQYVLLIGSILLILGGLYLHNETYYTNYIQEMFLYGRNIEKQIAKGADRDRYITHINRELDKSGLKDISVEITGIDLYGFENTLRIKATPPPTGLDKLLRREIKPIQIEYTFYNTRR